MTCCKTFLFSLSPLFPPFHSRYPLPPTSPRLTYYLWQVSSYPPCFICVIRSFASQIMIAGKVFSLSFPLNVVVIHLFILVTNYRQQLESFGRSVRILFFFCVCVGGGGTGTATIGFGCVMCKTYSCTVVRHGTFLSMKGKTSDEQMKTCLLFSRKISFNLKKNCYTEDISVWFHTQTCGSVYARKPESVFNR